MISFKVLQEGEGGTIGKKKNNKEKEKGVRGDTERRSNGQRNRALGNQSKITVW